MEDAIAEYKRTKCQKTRNNIVMDYFPLITSLANKLSKKYNFIVCDAEDMKISGVIGLIDAIEKYDHNKPAKFKSYAYYRIKGQILDDIRNVDDCSRGYRNNHKKEILNISIDKLNDKWYKYNEKYKSMTENEHSDNKLILQQLFRCLTYVERNLLYDYVCYEIKQYNLAKYYGVSQSFVSKTISNAIQKLRKRAKQIKLNL